MEGIDSIYSCLVFVTYSVKLWMFFVCYACSLRMSQHTVIYCCEASYSRANSGACRSHVLVYLKMMAALFSKVRA